MFAESLGELFKFIEDMKSQKNQPYPLNNNSSKSQRHKSEDKSEDFEENQVQNSQQKNGEKLLTDLRKKMDVVEMNVETIEDRLEMIDKDSKDRTRLMKEGVNAEIDTMKIFKEKVQLVKNQNFKFSRN